MGVELVDAKNSKEEGENHGGAFLAVAFLGEGTFVETAPASGLEGGLLFWGC